MGIKFSDDQQAIIDSRNENLLVSAAAGSGKTAVLVERIIKRITDPVNPIDIDKILVVTFTNAAAKEMKERIQKALKKASADDPSNEHLEKQLQLIHNALITTIDSFCLYLVKNHFNLLDIDPSMRVADKAETDLLKDEIVKNLIKEAYESGDETFFMLTEQYAGKNDDTKIEDGILKFYTFAMSYPAPIKWLEDRKKDYFFKEDTWEASLLYKELCDMLNRKATALKESMNRAIDICESGLGPETYLETLYQERDQFESLEESIRGRNFTEMLDGFKNLNKGRLSGKKCDCPDVNKKAVQNIRTGCWDEVKDILTKFDSFGMDTYLNDMAATGAIVNKFIDLTLEFAKRFAEEKRDRNIIDFTDMEHFAIEILVEDFKDIDHFTITETAENYKKYFEEVMIDEYQDSNLVQELILKSISRESDDRPNRFMVGDIKQSIYRFRLARPDIFRGKKEEYRSTGNRGRVITLKENYRSRDRVVDSVNAVFKDIMTDINGGLNYEPEDYLNAKADFTKKPSDELNNTEVVLLNSEGLNSDKTREVEAYTIAWDIIQLLGTMEVRDKDTGEMRQLRYGDIGLLFRSPSKWLDYLRSAFDELQIPYHANGTGDFYEAPEIREIVNFLKIINNPLEDIPMYGTLTSFFGKFSDEECARFQADRGDTEYYLYDKVKGYAERHPEDEKVKAFLKLVSDYRELSRFTPVNELLRKLIDESGYKLYVTAQKNGQQRAANVELLIDKARQFAGTSFHGAFHFVKYIELLKKITVEEGEASLFDEEANTVHVMSIHASKGLEFPVVILGGIDEKFNDSDTKASLITDIDLGIGADFLDTERRVKRKTLLKSVIEEKTKLANLGEEIRILYVAMTRAKEKLIMVGAVNAIGEDWLGKPGEGKKNSYLALMEDVIKENPNRVFEIRGTYGDEKGSYQHNKDEHMEELKKEIFGGLSPESRKIYKAIKERFSFTYPHENLSKLYTKTTVSELKMKAMEEQEEPAHQMFEEKETEIYLPRFAGGEERVKGTDRGTAYHKLLELIDYTTIKPEKSALSEQKTRLVNNGKMSEDELKIISEEKLLKFLESPVCDRMCRADKKDKLFKESPFVMGLPASEVEADFPKEETVLIQGVIDVYFIEDNEIVLLDYKTDRVSEGQELINRYKTQIDYYKKALEQLTGLKVKECILYSFALNEEVKVN